MALSDENGMNTTMLVSPASNYQNGGLGSCFGGDSWWILLLFILLGNGGFGFGGFGNMGMIGSEMYPWMNQANLTNSGFQNQMLNDNVTSIRDGISSIGTQLCGGFGNVQNSLCNGFAGVNATINGGFANAETAANARQMANMQQAFASQTAITDNMNSIAMGLQNCCCENRAGLADVKYTIATENCADRQAISDGIRDILTATQNQTTAILNQLCADKIEQKNDTIAQLRSELLYARGQASQDVQTAAIQAGQRMLANEVEQYVAPRAIPAYMVQNPNCCYQNGYSCNG